VFSRLLMLFGATYLLPLLAAIVLHDGMAGNFLVAGAVSAGTGAVLMLATRRKARELKPRDGFLLVTITLTLMSLSATIPFLLALPHLSFTHAFFEAVSGLTTSGATVLAHLDQLPPSINFWRATLNWYGGFGVIVLAVAILPLLGVGGMQIHRAEVPGPVKDEKLASRINETARSLWLVYIAFTATGILALRICGVSWLDAICHAFAAVSLGGFSTHEANIAWFQSPSVETVLIVLMILGSLNFARHFVAIRRTTLQPYTTDTESKAVALVLAGSVLGIAIALTVDSIYPSFGIALRHAAFNVISLATTTGFFTQNYEQWPVFAPIWMLFLACGVCSAGSLGGGIKMFRTLLLAKQASRELKLLVHPSAVAPVLVSGRAIPDQVGNSVLAFIFLYFMTAAALIFALLATGLDFDSAFGAIVASINNTGPGLGVVGPAAHNYLALSEIQTWICALAMILGRLEIFSVLVLFTPAFWRK
jgi:trk system potassium uptake protein TrkH